jgi:hypothetical protein
MAKRRKSSRFRYSYLGEQLLSLFVAPTKDQGFSLGFTDPAFKNIHFTLYFKKEDGRIHTHITDNSAKTKPYSQQISPEFYQEKINSLIKKWIVDISKLGDCYIPTGKLLKKLEKIAPSQIDENTIDYPLEFHYAQVVTNFDDSKKWKKVKPDQLASSTLRRFVLTEYQGVARWVIPLSDLPGKVLCISNSQGDKLLKSVMRLLGFDLYFEYIDSIIPDKKGN